MNPMPLTSNRPAAVPMSLSRISSVRLTMVAPQARAIRLLSVLRRRRMAEMPALWEGMKEVRGRTGQDGRGWGWGEGVRTECNYAWNKAPCSTRH